MAVSFAKDIVPLFDKQSDIPHMAERGVMLADYAYMSQPDNAQDVIDRLTGKARPRMPPPPTPAWSAEWIASFKAWMDGGYQP